MEIKMEEKHKSVPPPRRVPGKEAGSINKWRWPLLAACLCAAIYAVAIPRQRATVWDYNFIRLETWSDMNRMALMGEEGWEAIGPAQNFDGHSIILFKREMPAF